MLECLCSKFTMGALHLSNRFAMAPMTRSKAPGGVPTPAMAEYYRRRASGGVGLIITEGTLVDHRLSAEPGSSVPRIAPDTVARWRQITAAVHAEGAAIFAQLWHQGPQIRGGIAAFAVPEQEVSVATDDDLAAVCTAFASAASDAKQAGFDGVEVHGAHGYFIDSFLRTHAIEVPRTRRGRYVADLVRSMRDAVGPAFPIALRFSQWSLSDYQARYMHSPEELACVLLPLREAGVDIFHASVGFRSFWLEEFPPSPLTLAGWTRTITERPVITVGGIGLHADEFFSDGEGSMSHLEKMYANGEFDIAAIGRALIGDARWCRKVMAGQAATITPFRDELLEQYP